MSAVSKTLLLLLAVVLLTILPLFLVAATPDAEIFAGTDDLAEEVIETLAPDYEPWAALWWEPPSGEIESLLFALQAALGAGFIGYYFGRKSRWGRPVD